MGQFNQKPIYMTYDVNYFIKKFEAIQEALWCTDEFEKGDAKCANGHCGVDSTYVLGAESKALQIVFSPLRIRARYNNGNEVNDYNDYSLKAAVINNNDALEYQQPTPKQRILAALYDIKKLQEPEEVKERIVYVTVDKDVRELQKKELIEN